jgi:serine phosphatase RsbU (regulator of sigma subunit)
VEGSQGEFLEDVIDWVDTAPDLGVSLDNLRLALMELKRCVDGAGYDIRKCPRLEPLWLGSFDTISGARHRAEGRASLDLFERFVSLRYASQRLSMSLEHASLAVELERSLPRLGIKSACVALLTGGADPCLEPILVLADELGSNLPRTRYPRGQLLPESLLACGATSWLVMALSFEKVILGLFAVDGESNPLICEVLRMQISAAIQIGVLHRQVVESTAAQERVDQAALERDVSIARRIQSALQPKQIVAPGFDISGVSIPAKEVGGDYYDVVVVPGGVWLCVADVTGHGLLSGLVMMMIQSMVSALLHARTDASPAALLCDVNRALALNLRQRLCEQEYATMVAVRLFDDGSVLLAGSHEDLIVHRRASSQCELVPVNGVWMGILPDIQQETHDHGIQLEPGDLLVSYTDGLIEARNAHGEEFGIERLCGTIQAHAHAEAREIQSELLRTVAAWSAVRQDDLTCLIARYQPEAERCS